jgi:predicted phage tail protein
VAQTTKNGKAKSCKLTLALGTITHSGHSGNDTVTFQARVSSSKMLKPGRYTVTATATNASGQQSKPSSLSFTIVK